jgi:uncharacterized protein
MSEQENIKIAQQAYENFKTGDIQALLDLMTDDIDWELPEIENVSFARKYKGREGAAQFFSGLAEAQEAIAFNPQEFIAQADKVVVLGNYSWRVKITGREFSGDWAHVFTIRDGQIAGFKEYMDTAAASAAHQKAANT